MTWGDIQLESIRKMFVNTTAISTSDLSNMKTDKKYVTYLDAMPGVTNEAIMVLLTRGKPYVVQQSINKITTKNQVDGFNCYDLKDSLDNYISLYKVYINGREYNNYTIRANRYLYIASDVIKDGKLSVGYCYHPDRITKDTKDNEEIDLPIELVTLIPLYVASELYKDDDISLATYYRNEFETELAGLRIREKMEFSDAKGWL